MFSRRSLLKTAPAAFLGGFAAGAARDAVAACAAPESPAERRFVSIRACDSQTEADAVLAAWGLAHRFVRAKLGADVPAYISGYDRFDSDPQLLFRSLVDLPEDTAQVYACCHDDPEYDGPTAMVVYRGVRLNSITKRPMDGYHMYKYIRPVRIGDRSGRAAFYTYQFLAPLGWKSVSSVDLPEETA